MSTIPVHVGLVNSSNVLHDDEVAEVAAALNEQVQADFIPAWGGHATVGVYRAGATAVHPLWKIVLADTIDEPGAAGYHADANRQPYAIVDVADGDWSVTASHELLEMLADPFGSRMHTALAPRGFAADAKLRVHYLVEVCDPCEETVYEIGGVRVSDFLVPHYYRSSERLGDVYSHTGAIRAPRDVLAGGYVSFLDPVTGEWWQRFVDEHGHVKDQNLGRMSASAASLREFADACARDYRAGLADA